VRFLLFNQFYPPDSAPTGQFLHDVAAMLVQRGHEVEVVCSRRAYDGTGGPYLTTRLDGVRVSRVAATGWGRAAPLGRSLDYLSYAGLAVVRLASVKPRPDLSVALTTPPYIGLAVGTLSRLRGVPYALWVMDVYPDALAAQGVVKRGSRVFQLLGWLARKERVHAASIVALGPRAARRIDQSQAQSTSLWGPERASEEAARRLRRARGWGDELILLYSGNLGLGHRFGEFIEAARRLGPDGPRWVFSGTGARRPEVERVASDSDSTARIELAPPVARAEHAALLQSAQVHLASLSADWQGIIVPSKVIASFCVGRPVIFVGGRDNEAADWIRESGGGWHVEEGDVEGLLAAIQEASPDERSRRGAAARRFAETHFDRRAGAERVCVALEDAARGSRR